MACGILAIRHARRRRRVGPWLGNEIGVIVAIALLVSILGAGSSC